MARLKPCPFDGREDCSFKVVVGYSLSNVVMGLAIVESARMHPRYFGTRRRFAWP